MDLFPRQLRQMGPGLLGIQWSDGHSSLYHVRLLRLACRCAHCVDEWTGEKKLKPEDVAASVRPVTLDTVGRYALKISWSDGHDSGIYPFTSLRKLCECPQCNRQTKQASRAES